MSSRFDDAIDAYEKMRAAAAASGDKVAEARAWNGRGFIEQRKGDYQGLLASAERAEELAAQAGDALEASDRARPRLGAHERRLLPSRGGARAGGARDARAGAGHVSGRGGPPRKGAQLEALGMANQVAGRFEEAQSRKEEALAIFRRMGDHQTVGMMLNSLGETLRLKGDYAAARDRYQEALSIARETGHRPEQILCLSNLAGARLGLGEYEEAERLLREAIDLAGSAGYHVLPEAYRFLAEACLGQGRNDEALEAARLALMLSATRALTTWARVAGPGTRDRAGRAGRDRGETWSADASFSRRRQGLRARGDGSESAGPPRLGSP